MLGARKGLVPSSSSAHGHSLGAWRPVPLRYQHRCPAAKPSAQQQTRAATGAATSSLELCAETEDAMGHLADMLASQPHAPGDVYCLYGDVGAGKSVFSRAFIRAAADEPSLPVPSPTFLLQNIYEEQLTEEWPPIHHFDLYRLPTNGQKEMQRLNLQGSFTDAVCLLEWAERLGQLLPAEHLEVHISIVKDQTQAPRSGDQTAGQMVQGAGKSMQQGHQGQQQPQEHAPPAEESWGEDDEQEDDAFTDKRWRRVRLEAHGQRWQQRLAALAAALEGSADFGLQVLPGKQQHQ